VTVRIGLKLSQQVHPLGTQLAAWRMADAAGFDHLWLFDHLVAIHQEAAVPVFDGWTLLAAMATLTTRARIGLNVTGNLYRHPALLAKMAVTVDHLSGGRLEVGLGAGWAESEFAAHGMPFITRPADRIDALDETCHVLKALWTQPSATFVGKHYQLSGAVASPKPLQRPHPPIWIGGNGPRRTLRVAATHADAWSCDIWVVDAAAADRAHGLGRTLDRHCAEIGRDPASIRRAHVLLADGTDTPLVIGELSLRAGFTDFLVVPARSLQPGSDLRLGVEDAIRLLPRLRELDPAGSAHHPEVSAI
jgi:probable F420-dependent oxidoreductase